MGGGLRSGAIGGLWPELSTAVLDNGDVAGANDYRDLLSEILGRRLRIGATDLNAIFPAILRDPWA